MSSRILIVEDNADLAFAVAGVLESEGYETRTAGDGPTGLAEARAWRPHLIVLDLMLPGADGYQVLQRLRAEGHEVPVLVLTARGEEEDKVLGFRVGADDFVVKPFGVLEFMARVQALLRRPTFGLARGTPEVERFGEVEIHPAARKVTRRGTPVTLAPKEFELLLALVRRRGAAASRAELLREVWDYSSDVSSRTVDIHILELRRKLEPDPSRPRHILTVYKVGYRLDAAGMEPVPRLEAEAS